MSKKLLSECETGATGRVVTILSHDLKLQLLRLGLSEGDQISIANRALFGGTLAIAVNGHKVAIRKSDAAQILLDSSSI